MSQDLSKYSGVQLEQMTGNKDVQVASYTIQQASTVTGTDPASKAVFDSISTDINGAAEDSLKQQNVIAQRDPVTRFLFGGDHQASDALSQDAAIYQAKIDQLQQIIAQNPSVKPMLQRQIAVLVKEQARLAMISNQTRADNGILGGIFG
jgi:hypothetical protein